MFATTLAVFPLLIMSLIAAGDVHQGKVAAVGENTITLQDMDGLMETFIVAEDCQITHGGKLAALKDIDDGDVAKVTVVTVNGKPVAKIIEARCRS